jgi:hypothetical protein
VLGYHYVVDVLAAFPIAWLAWRANALEMVRLRRFGISARQTSREAAPPVAACRDEARQR